MKILILGLSWHWFFFFFIFYLRWCDFMLVNTLEQKLKFSYKEGNDGEFFDDSLEVWNLIQSGWFFFLQFSRSLKFLNRTEPSWKSNLIFWWDTLVYNHRPTTTHQQPTYHHSTQQNFALLQQSICQFVKWTTKCHISRVSFSNFDFENSKRVWIWIFVRHHYGQKASIWGSYMISG
jgi:hypothetical protein